MKLGRVLIIVTITISISGCIDWHRYFEDPLVHLSQDEDNYVFMVPESRFILAIPKSTGLVLKQDGSRPMADIRQEFLLESITWFEAKSRPEMKMWADLPSLSGETGTPRDLSPEEVGNWKVGLFETTIPRNTHAHASWIEHGTSIDVDISLTSDDSQADRREKLRQVLSLIKVEPKP